MTAVLGNFPMPLIGGMMFMVGVQFVGPMRKLRGWPLALALWTAAVAVLTNMALGFLAGLAAAWPARRAAARGTPQAATDV